jgi:proteasome accessory factor B
MSAARTERLLNLLTLLLNTRHPVSFAEIRDLEEFSAYRLADKKSGERAFERDKAVLVELGVPINWVPPEADDDGEGSGSGGYTIDRKRYYLPELTLAPGEMALLSIASAAVVANEHLPLRGTMFRALAKLGFDVDAATEPTTLTHAPLMAGIDPVRISQNLEVLHDAVARRRRVHLCYRGADGHETEREVDPYGLYYRQGAWYLVGHCHLRHEQRTFHLGRMQQVALAPKKKSGDEKSRRVRPQADFDVPKDFDLSAHARLRPWEFPGQPPTPVRIRLAKHLVPAKNELFGQNARYTPPQPGSQDQHIIELDVTNQSALVAAVLPYGAHAEVLSPPDLRARIGKIYETLAERYQSDATAKTYVTQGHAP